MERNNTDPSARPQKGDHLIQRIPQHLQLVIALDPDRLIGSLGGMSAALTHFGGNGIFNDVV